MKTDKTMNDRQDTIDFHRNYCVHYQPRETVCGAGVSDAERPRVATGPKGIKWGPCIGGHTLDNPCGFCPKWERRSLEEAEAYADDVEEMLRSMLVVDPVLNAWRSKGSKKGKQEVIECPVCKGRLHLEESSYNGHVHAKCETTDCVAFME